MTVGLERISGTMKAVWTIITIVISVVTAISSTAIYINNLNRTVADLKTQVGTMASAVAHIPDLNRDVTNLTTKVNTMSQQLKRVSSDTPMNQDYFNGTSTPHCESGSFIDGIRFGVDGHGNPHGTIYCAKVQPAIE
jgi:hypothetical protein